jgi:hypothetical protein
MGKFPRELSVSESKNGIISLTRANFAMNDECHPKPSISFGKTSAGTGNARSVAESEEATASVYDLHVVVSPDCRRSIIVVHSMSFFTAPTHPANRHSSRASKKFHPVQKVPSQLKIFCTSGCSQECDSLACPMVDQGEAKRKRECQCTNEQVLSDN